ncbi:hypothetical protein, unknown function [Leishmania tarentolae]|uniref:Uncharacterized protein n=1 Tax=Leishmania tarentolae TaxID=5689 RepID=A0A640KQ36_LEITA|nr:hypothetical protein, unknown function [Leishmania tarentolae]
MSSLYRCNACERLTTMSLCPRCEVSTEGYTLTPEEMRTVVGSGARASSPASAIQTVVPLTAADIDVLAGRDSAVSAGAVASQQSAERPSRSVEELEAIVRSLQEENAELREKLQRDRRQMLRSAMDVRDLHACQKEMRQRDLDRIERLHDDNQRLRKILEMQGTTQGLTDGVLPKPSEAALTTVLSPLSRGPGSLLETPLERKTMEQDLPALQAEVVRLRSALAFKTQHLEDLWERAGLAESYVQGVLQKLQQVQGIVREESESCSQRLRHLESAEEPLKDSAPFAPMRDRSRETQQAKSHFSGQSPFATVAWSEHIKPAATVHEG